jgi:NADH-quinone oxidoreductase subunit C
MTRGDELAALVPGVETATEFGDPVATVPPQRWVEAVRTCREVLGLTYLDLLTGVDDGESIGVVLYLWSPAAAAGLLLRTAVPAADPTLASITPLLPGADWHERETAEMFGVVFAGHPNPVPLLLPDPPPVPTPLRKSMVLERRTGWPGDVDPA